MTTSTKTDTKPGYNLVCQMADMDGRVHAWLKSTQELIVGLRIKNRKLRSENEELREALERILVAKDRNDRNR